MRKSLGTVSNVLSAILILLLAILLGLYVWSVATGSNVSHATMNQRLTEIRRGQVAAVCILSSPLEDRTPALIASCEREAANLIP